MNLLKTAWYLQQGNNNKMKTKIALVIILFTIFLSTILAACAPPEVMEAQRVQQEQRQAISQDGYVTVFDNLGEVLYQCAVSNSPTYQDNVTYFNCIIDGEERRTSTSLDVLYTYEELDVN